jgi:hypothetical protein
VSPYRPDESHIGIWLWLLEIAFINAWIPIDLWLRLHNHEYLTTEFKEGLRHPVWGPVLCFLVAGSVAAFVWHMWNQRDGVPAG